MSETLQDTPHLADRLVELLRQEIATSYKVGEKLPTIRELCLRYKVSPNTVGAALTILAREGLIHRRQGSGTYVSERTAGTPGGRIAIFTELDILRPELSRFFPCVFRELKQYFNAAGYRTQFYTGGRAPHVAITDHEVYDELMADVASGKIRGVVAPGVHFDPAKNIIQRLNAHHVPLVGYEDTFPYAVVFPFRRWLSTAIHHLALLGRRRLALVGWSSGRISKLFHEELAREGLDFHPQWVRNDIHPNKPGAGWTELREVWTAHKEKPDGLIISDDVLIPDACAAIHELGIRVPEQLMIVAHANRGCPVHSTLPMARVEYDTDAHARALGELMLKMIRGEPVPEPHVCLGDRLTVLTPEKTTEMNRQPAT